MSNDESVPTPEPAKAYCGALARNHKCFRPPGHKGPHSCLPLCQHLWR